MAAIRIIDSHLELADVGANDHHNELHSIVSHNDTSATGAQLDTLTDNSIADALHRHSELSASDGNPDKVLYLDSSGTVTIKGGTGYLQQYGNDASYPGKNSFTHSNTGWHGVFYSNYRAKGTSASPITVATGDSVFYFDNWGHDGSTWVRGAQLTCYIDGAVSTGVIPMSWQFNTMNTSGSYATRMVIKSSGQVGLGIISPATSALLDLTSTIGALLLTRMTTTQRDALTAVNGMVLYNSTLNKFQGYENGAWTSLI